MKDSTILKAARRLIEADEEHALCAAIHRAALRRGVLRGNALALWVMSMLDGHAYYSSWLLDKDPTFWRTKYAQWKKAGRYGSPWKEGRLQWLDWMIAECEKEEAK